MMCFDQNNSDFSSELENCGFLRLALFLGAETGPSLPQTFRHCTDEFTSLCLILILAHLQSHDIVQIACHHVIGTCLVAHWIIAEGLSL